ncbi:SLC13 family permease [Thauera phenolivorans]|uniref:SLC13 family permease n=1 Tax=Thauera phenolivorans TaxID=1792543 RepID=UPI00083A2971|nr:SLC13 family permease [Thauera phenolivorans]
MTHDQTLILIILIATIAMFLWGRWRHDMVAAGSLLACVLAGLVPPAEAFAGFGHPAVITVACVLVLSRGLQTSGAVDVLTRHVLPAQAGPTLSLAALVGVGALLSGFMNNVGAMALLMPVAVQLAGRLELPPGRVLMPLAFGTILGGMTTLIGTPPNLIVSGFRARQGDGGFAMFDFSPVGLAVAAGGVLFVALLGWRLVPARKRSDAESFDTGAYLTEARVPEKSKAAGMHLREIETELDKSDAQVVGLVRNEVRMLAPSSGRVVRTGDILLIEAGVDSLASALSSLGLELEEARAPEEEEEEEKKNAAEGEAGEAAEGEADGRDEAGERAGNSAAGVSEQRLRKHETGSTAKGDAAAEIQDSSRQEDSEDAAETEEEKEAERSDDVVLMELVVRPESPLLGRSAKDLLLRSRYGINLLALSREGQRSRSRLRTMPIHAGDLLLMQGPADVLAQFASDFGCVPLAARDLRIPDRGKALSASLIMAFAVGGAAFGLLPAAISFALGVLASMALRTVPPRAVYESVDWPVIVLLAALIPVAGAMESTGAAELVARMLLEHVARGELVIALALVLVVTMFLSDVMNNAATAAVMCPIAIGAAQALGVGSDAFLMAVAIGASCAFLTPIGHQNNTLILGPGGFRFGDYWRLGLPLELLVLAIALPMLLLVWTP